VTVDVILPCLNPLEMVLSAAGPAGPARPGGAAREQA
jgi:hypothetical protein